MYHLLLPCPFHPLLLSSLMRITGIRIGKHSMCRGLGCHYRCPHLCHFSVTAVLPGSHWGPVIKACPARRPLAPPGRLCAQAVTSSELALPPALPCIPHSRCRLVSFLPEGLCSCFSSCRECLSPSLPVCVVPQEPRVSFEHVECSNSKLRCAMCVKYISLIFILIAC